MLYAKLKRVLNLYAVNNFMHKNKKLVVAIVVLVAFLYIVSNLNFLLASTAENDACPALGIGQCPHKRQLELLTAMLPLIASIAIIAGALTYYLMAEKIEVKEQTIKNNTEVLLKFLNPDERKLVNLLIENNGKALQAELTRLPGMSKLKSHRIVQRLLERGVVEKESLGKTNIVRFTKEIKEGLL